VFSGHSCLNASKDFQVSENSRISIVQKNLGGSQVSLQPGLAAVDEAGKSGKNKPLNKKADKNRSAGKIRIPKPPNKTPNRDNDKDIRDWRNENTRRRLSRPHSREPASACADFNPDRKV
jgi:hypothetical protein